MQKRFLMALMAVLLISAVAPAQTVQSTSFITQVTEVKHDRMQTNHFYSIALQGGASTIDHGDLEPMFMGVFGYKHQLGKSNFLLGGQLTAGAGTQGYSGFFIDIAPTLSYLHFAGGFYNSFEATLGLGLGYRQYPSETFAFVPELNLSYWFNWFGIGATVRYSIQKSNYIPRFSYNWETGARYVNYYYEERGSQFFFGARFAVRF